MDLVFLGITGSCFSLTGLWVISLNLKARSLREKFELKKQDLALMLNISLPTLNRIEAGHTKIPEKCFQGLRDLRQDPEKTAEQQILFIEDKKRQILKSLKLRKD